MREIRKISLVIAALGCAILLSACGEFAYKRGAQSADLEQDRSTCHAAEKSGQNYEQCMAGRGWTLHNLDEEPLLATVGLAKDNREAASTPESEPVTGPAQTTAAKTTMDTAAATGASGEKPAAAKEPARPANPMDQLRVNSFWKLGGNSGELQGAIDGCVATLGPGHQPSADRQLMTRGLVRCLREKGWYGVTNR